MNENNNNSDGAGCACQCECTDAKTKINWNDFFSKCAWGIFGGFVGNAYLLSPEPHAPTYLSTFMMLVIAALLAIISLNPFSRGGGE